MKKNGELDVVNEAKAYLERRGQRRPKRDWAGILHRVMNGESQETIAKELGAASAQISTGLKRYAEKLVREHEEEK